MTQLWPELRGLFQTVALLHLAPKPGPGEAEPRPCSSAGWAGVGEGVKVVPCLCLDFPVPAPMRLRSGVGSDPGDRPTNQGLGELQPRPPGAETGTTSGHRSGAREREGGGAGRRLPGIRSRGTLGVALGCLGLGALCALAAGPRPLAGPAAPGSLPAPPPAAPLKRPRSSASVPPWTPRSRMMLQLVLLAALALCGEVPPGACGLRTS